MDTDQDWPSVYPTAAPFKPSAVPLPVRMGYPVKKGVPMAKEGNLELLKVSGGIRAQPAPQVLNPDPPHPLCEASSREQHIMF
jgi:small subunit ribosomal protein S35